MFEKYGVEGAVCFEDFQGQTVRRSVPIKGMKRTTKVQHGPGAKTAGLRPSAKRIERGRTIAD